MSSPFSLIASPSETSWNNPLLHLVFLLQEMFFLLLSLFHQRSMGCVFPSLNGRRAYVELISFAFSYPCILLLTPARPVAERPWCCSARSTASLPTVTPAQLSPPALVHNSNSSLFASDKVRRANCACARQPELGFPDKAPPAGTKLSRGGKHRLVCSMSEYALLVRKKMDKAGGWTL